MKSPEQSASPYAFNNATLDAPRKPGISALMRIRNGADFLRETIESHLPYYDEIIACHNDCSDGTEAILRELEAKHPGKVRVFHYSPRVHPPCSQGHRETPTESVHSLANYYNYCLAQARYCVAVKLDDDHIAISRALADCVRQIRSDLERGVRKLYTFSGLNLVRDQSMKLAVYGNAPFAGTGDIMYFPVCRQIYWRQAARWERLGFSGLRLQKQYMGLLFFHLKHLKPDLGFGNMEAHIRVDWEQWFRRTLQPVSFAELSGDSWRVRLRQRHNPVEYWFRTNPLVQRLVYALANRHPPLRFCRLERLSGDLAAIDWDRDLFAMLGLPREATTALPAHRMASPVSVTGSRPIAATAGNR